MTDAIAHLYVSTSCQHGRHDYCQADERLDDRPKVPARCKFCEAACLCPCHREEQR